MVRSLADLQKEDEKDDDKGTESYAGGAKSGLALKNPPGFDEAVARGAAQGGRIPEGASTVDLYRNGFIVNNGPFRPTSDPINKKFVDDILSGVAPAELVPAGSDKPLDLKVNDRRSEDYKPPVPGTGGICFKKPETKAADVSEGATAGPVAVGQGTVSVDESKPTTTLQIRFGDGSRKSEKFNVDATIQQLYDYVAQCTGTQTFTLAGGFPPKPLSDKTLTLKDAGLLQAQVMVKQ